MLWWVHPLFVFGKHYAVKFRKPLIALAVLAVTFGAGLASGYVTKADQVAEQARTDASAQVKTIIKQVKVRDEVEKTVYVEDLARVRKLEAEAARLRSTVADLQERVPLYVPETPAGVGNRLSVGAVRLLDDAAAGRSTPAGLPPGEPDGSDTAPSTVTWRSFVSQEIGLRGQYNLARNQCNALIQWVEDNVVNTPALPSK